MTADRLASALSDRYTIERELGAGGMATVYLAHDLKHDRKVALKVLKPELAAVLGAERFVQEIKTTANLQHPHILPLFDSGTADGFLYYVMPYIDGETLREKLDRESQLGVDEAVKIATEVADALDYAHRQEVIHRDIKPENILLHDGRPMVADFGIALAVSAAAGGRMTETGLSLGTPHYMSPEQATAERQVTHRSDIYSLGCVLYEMLAGDPPHTGSSAQAIILKIIADSPRPVAELRKSVPPNVAAAVAIALEKLPADRFGSAAAFAEALATPGYEGPTGPRAGHPIPAPRVSWRVWLLATVSVVLAALAIWGWSALRHERSLHHVQHLPLDLRDPPRGRSFWSSGVELAPGGDRIAYRGVTGEWHLLDLSDGTNRPLGITGTAVAFSPSGDSLAHTTSAYLQQLYVVDLATGRSTQLTDSAAGRPVWSEDGWIYYTLNPGVQRTRVSDGKRETLAQPEGDEQWYGKNVVPLTGGRGVLFTKIPRAPRNPSKAEIVALNVLTGDSEVLTTGVGAQISPSGHLLIAQLDGSLLAGRFDEKSMKLGGPLTTVLGGLEIRETSTLGPSISLGRDGTLLYVEARLMVEDTVVFAGRDGQLKRAFPTWGGAIATPVGGLAYREDDDLWAASVHRGISVPSVFTKGDAAGEPRRLTFSEYLDYTPRFIPQSTDIAFVSILPPKNWDLYRVPFDGGVDPALILDRPGDIHVPRFTADGRWVVFCEADRLGQRDVVAHRFEPDSVTMVLVGTDARECDPDVSPDGRWLVYTSDETGATEVYVRPFDARMDARWQVSRDGGTSPTWGDTGRELFYLNARNELVAVPVLEESSFSFGSSHVLFPLDDRSVWTRETASGDQEFILIRTQPEAPGQVVLIRNFFELLKEKVG